MYSSFSPAVLEAEIARVAAQYPDYQRPAHVRIAIYNLNAAAQMTIADADIAHDAIPADKRNNNCVQDAQWRLRDAIKLARHSSADTDPAPSYVVQAVAALRSWL